MKKTYLSTGASQTKKSGEILAQEVIKTKLQKTAFLLCLEGSLGGGKTTFLQGFARGLGVKEKVLSPTFVLMRKFQILFLNQQAKFQNFYHFDCYRIESPKELLSLGFKEIIKNPQNIVAIEWADKIKKIIPQKSLWLKFELIDKEKRKITITHNF